MNSITELPPDRSKEDVHPLTFIELLYICTYHEINNTPGFATRYPITGIGSNVPGNTIVMTTTKTEKRKMLNDNWEIDDSIPEFFKIPCIRNGLFQFHESTCDIVFGARRG